MFFFHDLEAGVLETLRLFWESLFGLIFGFLISAIVQVVLTPASMERYLGPNARGVVFGALFGIISSACSYGAAAAARGFYQRGADVRSVFSFLISSTNMNLAILILFWSLLGWRFAFAEFFGGIIIIVFVVTGLSVLFRRGDLERLRTSQEIAATSAIVTECPICGMEGEPDLAVQRDGTTYLACGQKHYAELRAGNERQRSRSLTASRTWREVAETAWNDVGMLRTELLVGYLVAGFAAALVPPVWLSHALQGVGSVPYIGYVLLLLVGLALAVITFVCSMGNVPIARFLAGAGIPLGANTTFIYGDLLIPPLVSIYRKSFPRRIVWSFLVLFVVGACVSGAIMQRVIGNSSGALAMGSMTLNDRLTTISNVIGIVAVVAVCVAAYAPNARRRTLSKL